MTTPCAFVLSEDGEVKYPSRSKPLIDAHAWIPPHMELRHGSLSHRVRNGEGGRRGLTTVTHLTHV